MLKDLFESLRGFFTDQAKLAPVKLDFSDDHSRLWYWVPGTKTVEQADITAPDKRHLLLTTDNVVAFVHRAIGDSDIAETMPAVWVGDSKITVEVQVNEHRDLLEMRLIKTPLYALLEKLRDRPSVTQHDAIRILRQDFFEFDSGSKALTAVRNVRITKLDDVQSEQSHTANRIGKSIQQEAAGAAELPEYIDVSVSVFAGVHTERKPVRVWLSVDFTNPGHFRFEPNAVQLIEALALDRADIANEIQSLIDNELVAVYEGEYRVQ